MGVPPEKPHDSSLKYIECTPIDPLTADVPVRFVYHQELSVTPEQLFDVFDDPTSWPRWAPGIGHVEWTSPQPYQKGTTRTVTFWGGAKVYEDFIVYDRPNEMAFTFYGTSELMFHRFGEHYRVEDLGEGRCRLTWTVAYEPAGGLGRVHRFIKPIMRFNLRTYMFWLKRYCNRL